MLLNIFLCLHRNAWAAVKVLSSWAVWPRLCGESCCFIPIDLLSGRYVEIPTVTMSVSSQVWKAGWGVQKEHWNPEECPFQGPACPQVPYRGEDAQHRQVRHHGFIMDNIMHNEFFSMCVHLEVITSNGDGNIAILLHFQEVAHHRSLTEVVTGS